MTGSIVPSSMNGGSPVRGSYDDVRALREGEREKEEEAEGIVDVQGEPLPPIFQLPPEILALIFKYTAGSDLPGDAKQLCAIRRVCHLFNELSDDVLLMYWNKLRGSQIPLLHSFSNAIEGRIGSFDFSYFFRFHVLTESLRRMGTSIPKEDPETAIQPVLGLQPLQYVNAHQKLLDTSLEAIWPKIRDEINSGRGPMLPNTATVRKWLNDPTNAGRLARITDLDLSGLGLRMLPPEIGKLAQLQRLYLHSNQLAALPPEIGKLTELQHLYLNGNRLAALPLEICNLTQLQTLYLHSNQLATLPPEIGNLTELQKLLLNNNQLVTLPLEICNLTELQTLHLNNNQLVTLPPEIGNLTQLQTLLLNDNQLATLPLEISNLPQLLKFFIYNNPLLFVLDKNLSTLGAYKNLNPLDFANKHAACSNHFCQSSLAALCQAIHRGVDDETLRENFEALSPDMQHLIRDEWAAMPSSSSSSSQSKGDLFDNRGLFAKAVTEVLRKKLCGLSQEEKNLVYQRVWELGGRPSKFSSQHLFSGNDEWGKAHAEDNIIRLIDAMELISH